MASAPVLLRFGITACRARSFHTSPRWLVKVGDQIPSVELVENSPGNKVNLNDEIKGRALIIGVPAAFSPGCSNSHIPGFIKHPKLKNAGDVFVVSVNDPFVTKAWGEQLDPTGESGIRFLGDPSAKFTELLDLGFDGSSIFGGVRSKRYALWVDDGKITEVYVEPNNTGINVSSAEKVLDDLTVDY